MEKSLTLLKKCAALNAVAPCGLAHAKMHTFADAWTCHQQLMAPPKGWSAKGQTISVHVGKARNFVCITKTHKCEPRLKNYNFFSQKVWHPDSL